MLISNSLMPTYANACKKAIAKKLFEFGIFPFCTFFRVFLLLTFIKGIFESWHQRI